jgi:hypothetical protein
MQLKFFLLYYLYGFAVATKSGIDVLHAQHVLENVGKLLIAFTDDMTIVGKTPEYLQNSLDLLYKW